MPYRVVGHRRRAFTLVELLVVIAIIGILVALLLPAIQAAREAANRSECSNNQKQICLALQNYHDTYKIFPPGGIECGGNGAGLNPPWPGGGANCRGTYGRRQLTTWAIAILPFVEQQAVYDRYDQNYGNTHDNNRWVAQQFLDGYICPSDINTQILARPASGPRRYDYAPGSYRALSGVTRGYCGRHFDEDNNLNFRDRGLLHVVYTSGRGGSRWKAETMSDVIDGTSNTLVVGEYHTKTHNTRRTFWAYTYTSYNQSSITRGSPTAFGVPDYNECTSGANPACGNSCKRAFASFHPGGLNFGLADGSVRFVSNNTNINVLSGLGTIAGAEVVNLD